MATDVEICLCALLFLKIPVECLECFTAFVLFFFFLVSMVKSRERKRLDRYSDKIKDIVCRTVYVLYTYLCNDSSVPLVFCFLCLVTYQVIIPLSTQMPSRWLAVMFFYKGTDLLMFLHWKMRFVCKCMPLKCMLQVLCMHILSYLFFRSP